jgi:putative hydrolase of HD superfamily
MEHEVTTESAEAITRLGGLVLQFARIDRATAMEDGVTPESDTDHTVMLGVIACAFAQAYEPSLDIGKIAQFALAHDLVEVYAGDTDTYGLATHDRKEDKSAREATALARIQAEFGATLPWVPETIHAYESLESPEARFLKTLDKVTPKVTNLLNEGRRLRSHGGEKEFGEFCAKQLAFLRESYGHDQPAVLRLYELMVAAVMRVL